VTIRFPSEFIFNSGIGVNASGSAACCDSQGSVFFVDYFRLMFAYTRSMTNENLQHRVYMSFQDRNGWRCQFLEPDLKTALPRKLHFSSAEKVVELVERGGGLSNLESRQALDLAIEKGRGGVFLSLSEEQYAKLMQ
jgi:hypothetical protein